jgi:hypothetical protein
MKNAEATTTNTAATVAEQGAHVPPKKAPSKKEKGAPKGQKTAQSAKTKPAAKKKTKTGKKVAKAARKEVSTPRAQSKGAKILALIGRPKGATLNEIMKATAWQAHSVRGFLSLAAKKHKLKIESAKNEAGERVYNIKK